MKSQTGDNSLPGLDVTVDPRTPIHNGKKRNEPMRRKKREKNQLLEAVDDGCAHSLVPGQKTKYSKTKPEGVDDQGKIPQEERKNEKTKLSQNPLPVHTEGTSSEGSAGGRHRQKTPPRPFGCILSIRIESAGAYEFFLFFGRHLVNWGGDWRGTLAWCVTFAEGRTTNTARMKKDDRKQPPKEAKTEILKPNDG